MTFNDTQTINSIIFSISYILFLNTILFKNGKIEYNFILKNYKNKNNITYIDIYACCTYIEI